MSEYAELLKNELENEKQKQLLERSEQVLQKNKRIVVKGNSFVRIKSDEKLKRQYIRFYELGNADFSDILDLSLSSSPIATIFAAIFSPLVPIVYFMERSLAIPSGWWQPSDYGKLHGDKAFYFHGTAFDNWLVSHTAGWTVWLSIPAFIVFSGVSFYVLVKRLRSEKTLKKFEEHLWREKYTTVKK